MRARWNQVAVGVATLGVVASETTPAAAQTGKEFTGHTSLPAWRWATGLNTYSQDLSIFAFNEVMSTAIASMALGFSSFLWRIMLWVTELASVDLLDDDGALINDVFNQVAVPVVNLRLHQILLIAGFGWAILKASKTMNLMQGLREGARLLLPYGLLMMLFSASVNAPVTGPQPKGSLGWIMASANDSLGEFATLPTQVVSDTRLHASTETGGVCGQYIADMHETFLEIEDGNPLAPIPATISSMWEIGFYDLWANAQIGDADTAARSGCHLAEMSANVDSQRQELLINRFVDRTASDADDYLRPYTPSTDQFVLAGWGFLACDLGAGGRIRVHPDWEGVEAYNPGSEVDIPLVPGFLDDVANDVASTTTGGVIGEEEERGDALDDAACEAFLADGIGDENVEALFSFHHDGFEESTGGEGTAYTVMNGYAGNHGGQRLIYSVATVAYALMVLLTAGAMIVGMLFAQLLGIAIGALLSLLLLVFLLPIQKASAAQKRITALLIYSVAGKFLMLLTFSVFVVIAQAFATAGDRLSAGGGLDRAVVSAMTTFGAWWATKKLFEVFDVKVGGFKNTIKTTTGLAAAGIVSAGAAQGMMGRTLRRESYMMQARMAQRFSPLRRMTGSGRGRRAAGFAGGAAAGAGAAGAGGRSSGGSQGPAGGRGGPAAGGRSASGGRSGPAAPAGAGAAGGGAGAGAPAPAGGGSRRSAAARGLGAAAIGGAVAGPVGAAAAFGAATWGGRARRRAGQSWRGNGGGVKGMLGAARAAGRRTASAWSGPKGAGLATRSRYVGSKAVSTVARGVTTATSRVADARAAHPKLAAAAVLGAATINPVATAGVYAGGKAASWAARRHQSNMPPPPAGPELDPPDWGAAPDVPWSGGYDDEPAGDPSDPRSDRSGGRQVLVGATATSSETETRRAARRQPGQKPVSSARTSSGSSRGSRAGAGGRGRRGGRRPGR